MKKIIILILFFNVSGLFAQETDVFNFKLAVKPASGGENGYIINFIKDSLSITLVELKVEDKDIVMGTTKKTIVFKLSNCQLKKIKKYTEKINDIPLFKQYSGLVLDSWEFEFSNERNKFYFNSNDIAEKIELKSVKDLIKYLKKITSIKIGVMYQS